MSAGNALAAGPWTGAPPARKQPRAAADVPRRPIPPRSILLFMGTTGRFAGLYRSSPSGTPSRLLEGTFALDASRWSAQPGFHRHREPSAAPCDCLPVASPTRPGPWRRLFYSQITAPPCKLPELPRSGIFTWSGGLRPRSLRARAAQDQGDECRQPRRKIPTAAAGPSRSAGSCWLPG